VKNSSIHRIILSGGGTGGHIFPAVAIANEIKAIEPSAEILFVGANGKMEMDKVPRAGYSIVGLPVSAFHRGWSARNFAFPFKLVASMIKANRVIKKFKPDLVIGTGGFASGPILRVANRHRIATLIQEQNSFPGVTNRLLAKKVKRICVAYPNMDRYFPKEKIILTGNPVRADLKLADNQLPEARNSFHISGNLPVILVFGGSQGARTLNNCMLAQLGRLANEPVEIIWQTGTAFFPVASKAIENGSIRNITVLEFIQDMKYAYALARLVVCRSGAITLSELALLGKPAVLVPLPSAAENHQFKNAKAYVDAGASLLVADDEAQDRLIDTMIQLVNDPEKLQTMSSCMIGFAKPDAVKEIAREALNLINNY